MRFYPFLDNVVSLYPSIAQVNRKASALFNRWCSPSKDASALVSSGQSNANEPQYVQGVFVQTVAHLASQDQTQWYPPIMIGADTVKYALFEEYYVEKAKKLLSRLTADDYTSFLIDFYNAGQERYGARWRYADIVTVLLCLSEHLKPRRYLEIGVRRGRSVAAVASVSPECSLDLFDMWAENYAGMPNPGPALVREELKRVGHVGSMTFIDGDSHVTLPEFLKAQPEASFDLVTVDGDHSPEGATMDLSMVLPRLKVGGAIVFDDICHPLHPELAAVWQELVVSKPRFSSFSFSDVGYGVGFGIRKY